MADVTISQLSVANTQPNNLLPYSNGTSTQACPVSAIFQNL